MGKDFKRGGGKPNFGSRGMRGGHGGREAGPRRQDGELTIDSSSRRIASAVDSQLGQLGTQHGAGQRVCLRRRLEHRGHRRRPPAARDARAQRCTRPFSRRPHKIFPGLFWGVFSDT